MSIESDHRRQPDGRRQTLADLALQPAHQHTPGGSTTLAASLERLRFQPERRQLNHDRLGFAQPA
jgi:hypothetical protein